MCFCRGLFDYLHQICYNWIGIKILAWRIKFHYLFFYCFFFILVESIGRLPFQMGFVFICIFFRITHDIPNWFLINFCGYGTINNPIKWLFAAQVQSGENSAALVGIKPTIILVAWIPSSELQQKADFSYTVHIVLLTAGNVWLEQCMN